MVGIDTNKGTELGFLDRKVLGTTLGDPGVPTYGTYYDT